VVLLRLSSASSTGTPPVSVSRSSGGTCAISSRVIARRISPSCASSSGGAGRISVGESPQCWFVIGTARWRGRSLTAVSSTAAAARATRKREWIASLALVSFLKPM
jgi:hypothetical protein